MGVRHGGEPKRAAGLFSQTMQHKEVFYGLGFGFVWHAAVTLDLLQ